MWLLTEDGAVLNLDRTWTLEVRADGEGAAALVAQGEGQAETVVARGPAHRMAALVQAIIRELDADMVAVLDVRTGKGAVT